MSDQTEQPTPAPAPTPAPTLGRPPKYPWDTLMDGNGRLLIQGRDYHDCTPESFRAMFRREANRRGLDYTNIIDADDPTIAICQATPKETS